MVLFVFLILLEAYAIFTLPQVKAKHEKPVYAL